MENQEKIQATTNPLIEKSRAAIPGVVFRLPSLGKIYGEGILSDDVENGEVLVYPMRLKEELKMKSVDSILQGTAVSETIRYSVPQVLSPVDLCPEDVDYLITAIKKMTHGSSYRFKDVCMKIDQETEGDIPDNAMNEMTEEERKGNLEMPPQQVAPADPEAEVEEKDEDTEDTENKDDRPSNVNNLGEHSNICEFKVSLDFFLNNAKSLDIEQYRENNTLELGAFILEFHPITFRDYRDLSTMNLKDQTSMSDEEYFEFIEEFSNTNIAKRIKRVDDIENPEHILEWVQTLPLKDREKIFAKVGELQGWGIDFTYDIKCSACGKTKKTNQSYINPLYFFLT